MKGEVEGVHLAAVTRVAEKRAEDESLTLVHKGINHMEQNPGRPI